MWSDLVDGYFNTNWLLRRLVTDRADRPTETRPDSGRDGRPAQDDGDGSAGRSDILINRRTSLAALGTSVIAPAVATGDARAADQGYGAGGYGNGGYGDPANDGTDEEEPDAVPQIVRLAGEDASNSKNPHADVSIEWEASLADGELHSAELTASDVTGEVLSWTYDLNGPSAERSESERIKHGGGTTYTVELTVYSDHGTSESEQTTFDAP